MHTLKENRVPEEVAQSRCEQIMAIQHDVSEAQNKALIDTTTTVIIDGVEEGDTLRYSVGLNGMLRK